MNASACDLHSQTPAKPPSASQNLPGPFLTVQTRFAAGFILGTPAEQRLAAIAAGCASVVVCRASPSQKAAVVRMMMQYELATAQAGKRSSLGRWLARYRKRMDYKMLAIGDGEAGRKHATTADKRLAKKHRGGTTGACTIECWGSATLSRPGGAQRLRCLQTEMRVRHLQQHLLFAGWSDAGMSAFCYRVVPSLANQLAPFSKSDCLGDSCILMARRRR